MSTNKKTYLIISHEIKINKKLDPANKMILGEIEALSKLPKGCYAPESHFADILNITRSAVNKRLNKLEKDQYIFAKRITKNKKTVGKQYKINMKKLIEENEEYRNNLVVDSSEENETLDLEVDNDCSFENDLVLSNEFNSSDRNEIVPEGTSDSSLEDILIVPQGDVDSSQENTTNTVNNTLYTTASITEENTSIIQEKQNNTGMSIFEFKEKQIIENITKLFLLAERGEDIYREIRSENDLKHLRGLVAKNENFEEIKILIQTILNLEKK